MSRVLSLLVLLAALAPHAVAQQAKRVVGPKSGVMHVMQAPALAPAADARPGEEAPIERLAEVLRRLPVADGEAPIDVRTGIAPDPGVLVVLGTPAQITVTRDAIDASAVAKPEPLAVPLQFTAVHVPAAVVRAHRLRPLVAAPSDDHGAALMRDAVKAGGSLANLPEVQAAPLARFTVAAGAARGGSPRPPSLRGVLARLTRTGIAVALDVERTGADGKPLPVVALPSLRLEPGRSAVVVAADGDPALVILVRRAEQAVGPAASGR